jgi:hypothetical protein
VILLIKREGFSILSLIRKTAKYVEYGMKNSHMGLIIHRCTLWTYEEQEQTKKEEEILSDQYREFINMGQ